MGKLTVAREVAKITKFKLFHNHLVFDLVDSLLVPSVGDFWEVVTNMRTIMIAAAARNKVEGVVSTFVYVKGEDHPIRDIRTLQKKNTIQPCWVQLTCSNAELKRRVVLHDRKATKKISTVKGLQKLLTKWTMNEAIPLSNSLVVDNTNLTPKQVAKKIVSHFSLQ